MAVAVKRLRIGRRRSQVLESSPLELALAPALDDERWRVPDRFNFTRDVVEVLGQNVKRRALTFVGPDGIMEPRTFHDLYEGANRWAAILRGKDVRAGDRVLVLSGANVDWVECMLGCVKVGAVVVPSPPDLSAAALEARFAASGAALIVAADESKAEIAQMSFAPEVLHLFEGRRRRASDVVADEPTENTSARDVAFVVWTAGTSGSPKPVAHTHGSTYAVRCQAEHWLDAGPGDIVWCTAAPGSLHALTTNMFGAWARGAEVALHDGAFDPLERLELIHRFDATIVCQTPAEYRALAGRRELARYRSRRLRRLVSTGDELDPEVIASFEETWGTTIRNSYGQAETNVVVAHGQLEDAPAGSLGQAVPGHHVAVVDEQGNELPAGVEGSLAVRGRPPTLFAGYWDSPEETREAFRGDWYLTGDVAVADASGFLWFVARSEDLITSRGRTFGPHEVERVLGAHAQVRNSAVVGIRDLERGGQFVRAFVVLEPGVESTEQLEAELRQFVGQSLDEQQVPREIEFIDTLPTAVSGALMRSALRDRPVAGRPLWELPPTSELEPETEPPSTEPAATAAVTVQDVAPEPAAAEPAVELVQQVVAEPAPVPEAPPAPAEPVAPEPVASVPETLPPPVPDPLEPEADEPAAEPAPEHVAEFATAPPAEPDLEAIPEPAPEPLQHAADPPPEALLDPVPEATPVRVPEPDPEPDPSATSEPVLEAAAPAVETAPAPVVEPPAEPQLEALRLPEAEPEPGPVPEAEPEDQPEPVLEAAPEPTPLAPPHEEPLPDFVVAPQGSSASGPTPLPAPPSGLLEDEEEEDLGPLPEYVVDPERRLEPVASVEPEPSPPAPAPTPAPAPEPDASPASLFPSAPVLDLGSQSAARGGGEDEPARPGAARPRPVPPPTPKRSGSTAEPGDEQAETTWMQGLSSRLSAYSLGSEEGDDDAPDEPAREPEDDDTR